MMHASLDQPLFDARARAEIEAIVASMFYNAALTGDLPLDARVFMNLADEAIGRANRARLRKEAGRD